MFVNVNLKIFKKRVVVILDDHLDKLHEALEPQLFQKSNRDPGKKQVQNPRTSPGSLK